MAASSETRPQRGSLAFRDMPIAWKLRGLAGVVCLLLIILGVVGIYQLSRTQDRLDQLYNSNLHEVRQLGEVATGYKDVRLQMRGVAVASGTDGTDAAIDVLDASIANLDQVWGTFTASAR